MTTAVATAPKQTAIAQVDDRTVLPIPDLRRLVGAKIDIIRDALPEKMKGAAPRFAIALITACQQTPKLAECTALSLFGALVKAANLGLEIGSECWIIPRRNHGVQTANFQVGYRGVVAQLYRHPLVARVAANSVCEGDEFLVEDGTESRIVHRYGKTRGAVTHYYCVIKLRSGESVHKVMTVDEVDAHRIKFSEFGKGPGGERKGVWLENFDAMALKTVIVQAAKTSPRSVELAKDAAAEEVEVIADDILPAEAVQPRRLPASGAEGEIVSESKPMNITADDLVGLAKAIADVEGGEPDAIEFDLCDLMGAKSFDGLNAEQMGKAQKALERRLGK